LRGRACSMNARTNFVILRLQCRCQSALFMIATDISRIAGITASHNPYQFYCRVHNSSQQ
jgi:hypothetical protein